ncbi:transposable element Tc1 transposase [Trichonephila clavipes]|nr:transposable element Tc1 transposase [Trichonephila clavipes]
MEGESSLDKQNWLELQAIPRAFQSQVSLLSTKYVKPLLFHFPSFLILACEQWDLSTPPRRNKEKFQQPTNFERGKIISLREGGFSYRAIGARVQRDSSTVMRIWKQWIDEYRTTRKTGSGRRKVTSARDDRHLLRMTVSDRTASSRELAARWSTATGILMSASSIPRRLLHRGLRARENPLAANLRRLHLHWAHAHRAWQAD